MKSQRIVKNGETRKNRASRGLIETLVVVALILIIPLFFTINTMANEQTAQKTPAPQKPTSIPTVESAGVKGKQPPACTFPLAETTSEEAMPEEYTFSEPQKVLIDPSLGSIDLYQWLPNNQQVLIGRKRAENSKTGYTIELLNPQTGDSQVYGARPWPSMNVPPVWVTALDAVIYPTTIIPTNANPPLVRDSNGMPIIPPSTNYSRQIWLSKGYPANVQSIENELVTVANDHRPTVGSAFTIAVSPDGSQLVYMDNVGSRLNILKVTHGALQTVPAQPFDAAKWDYRRPSDDPTPISFQMTWRPNSNQILLYNNVQVAGYTFLFDIQNGNICELNLFGPEDPNEWRKSWAMLARWSPNGRYLAIVRTKGFFPIDFSDLIVLDTATGNLYQTDATKFSPSDLDLQGRHYIVDVAWAHDDQHLAVIGYVNSAEGISTPDLHRLFLLDFLTGKAIQISSVELGFNMDANLLWSNDDSQLLVKCPGGLCLISVQENAQP